MPATDYHQQQGPFSSFGRTLFSLRRDTPPHAAAMPPPPEAEEAAVADLEASFQRRVAGVLSDLREGSGDDGFQFLSAPWLLRLLEAFLLCQDDFRAVSSAAYPWAPPLLAITDRLAEEGKRKDSRRSNSCGFFLKEIHGLEKSSRRLSDAIDAGERMDAAAVREAAAELAAACAAVKDGLDPLERTVREVFRCVVRCRMEGLDLPLLAAG